MLTVTVILLLLNASPGSSNAFRMYKQYSRSVDTRSDYGRALDSSQYSTTQSPCPNVFQYKSENGDLIGTVRVDETSPVNGVQLDIELSVGNTVQGYNGKIVLAEEREKVKNDILNSKPVFYNVLFPAWQNFPPRVTMILVNGKLICSGPKIPVQMVPVLTTINLQHKLSVTTLSDPSQDNNNNNNNLGPTSNEHGSQNQDTQYTFDVRVDSLPNKPNNIFTVSFQPEGSNPYNFNPVSPERRPSHGNPPPRDRPPYDRPPPGGPPYGRPPPGPPPYGRPPPGRPPYDRPPPNNRPPPDEGQIYPENPFLNGLSTPEPSRGDSDIQIINGNNPFPQRTESPLVFSRPSTTETPPRTGVSTSNGAITGNLNEICGRPLTTNSLIVNGQSVPAGAYPWLVALVRQLQDSVFQLSYICSGSLISERHVVTAAHCVKIDNRRLRPSELLCVFGKLNIRRWGNAGPYEKLLEPDSITVHPDYVTGKANADIALMTFLDPIPFSNMVRPVCLWRESTDLAEVVAKIGTVVGWGKDENGESTAEPRQVNMPIVDSFSCVKTGSTTAQQTLISIVSENTFCAGFRNGSGPCNGDSGSGFLLKKNGVFFLRGIVSTAVSDATSKTCNLHEYVVFTDTSKHLKWITTTMGQL